MEKIRKILDWVRGNKRVLIFLGLIFFSLYGAWMIFGRLFLLAVGIYAVYYAVKHRSELANTRFQDWINPLKWGSVLFASFMSMMFPLHIVHQLILRMYDPECRKCVNNGSCFHCGCNMSKIYTPWDACSKGNWVGMIESPDEYWEMRTEWPVRIDISYPREEEAKLNEKNINQ